MSKFLFDALEGIIYKDDAQIVKATLEKKNSYDPSILITISKM